MSPAAWRSMPDAELRERNTFGVAAQARWLLEVDDASALPEALAQPQWRDAPLLPLGGGSNLLFAGDHDGVALSLRARTVAIVGDGGHADAGSAIVRADAGLPWHDFVMWSLRQGFCGLENLALIPGTVGAAPIQNIGAYGVEVGEFVHAVDAFDIARGRFVRLAAGGCAFAYRDSVFKREPDRRLVVAVEFALPRRRAPKLDYAGIADELRAMDVAAPGARDIAEAVVRIRRRKLPDPAVVGNAGSFFKNPIVPAAQAEVLQSAHPALPVFRGDGDGTRKLSAAWMIEACGWKGFREGDAGVSAAHALVLVNHGNARGAQLLALARRIAASVQERFGVDMEPEPRIVGAAW